MTVGKRFSQILRRSLDVPAPAQMMKRAPFDDAVRRRCGVIRVHSAEGPTSYEPVEAKPGISNNTEVDQLRGIHGW